MSNFVLVGVCSDVVVRDLNTRGCVGGMFRPQLQKCALCMVCLNLDIFVPFELGANY